VGGRVNSEEVEDATDDEPGERYDRVRACRHRIVLGPAIKRAPDALKPLTGVNDEFRSRRVPISRSSSQCRRVPTGLLGWP